MTWHQSLTWARMKSIMDKRSVSWDWPKVEPWSGWKTTTPLSLRKCQRIKKSTDFSSSLNNSSINTCTTKTICSLFHLAASSFLLFCWYWAWSSFSKWTTYSPKHHPELDCSKNPNSDSKFEDTFPSTSFHLMAWAPTSIMCTFQTKLTPSETDW
jgi:hypothetical protein